MNAAIVDFAQDNNLDANIIDAIFCVENRSRQAFDFMGRPVIRFELHQFYKYIPPDKEWMANKHFLFDGNRSFDHYYTFDGDKYKYVHANQESEHIALAAARVIDNTAALMSTGFGVGQIMGFNYKNAGFDSVEEMLQGAMTESGQYKMALTFMSNNKTLMNAIRNKDLTAIATIYNGSGNVPTYVAKLKGCLG